MIETGIERESMTDREIVNQPSAGQIDAEGGFTILEVMIAAALFTVVSLALAMIVIPVSREQRASRQIEAATSHARNIIEELQTLPYPQVVDRCDPALWPQTVTLAGDPQSPNVVGTLEVNAVDLEVDPLQIEVKISWNSHDVGDREQTYWVLRTR